MELLRDLALSYVGTPYHFGGKSPVGGIDCSGFVSELLKSCGVLPHRAELNAQGLYDLLEKTGSVNRWGLGAIAFYGKGPKEIDHVAFCLDTYRMIEAGGGDHTTIDLKSAAEHNACVRVRLIKFRQDFFCVIKPDYATIGVIK